MKLPSFLFRQTVTLESYTGNSAYGPKYATPITVKCRIEPKISRKERDMINGKGNTNFISQLLIFFPSGTVIKAEDKITYNSKKYQVMEIKEIPSLNSISYIEVVVQSA